MKESITISRIDQQQLVHPDAIHAKAAAIAVRSVVTGEPWERRLRPVESEELQGRPIGLVALDRTLPGENAHVGHVFVKAPIEGYAEISTLYVEPSHGGNGIAKQLVHNATSDTLLAGWTPMAFAANPLAQATFEHAGYRPVDASELPVLPYNPEAIGYVLDTESAAAETILESYHGV